MLELWRIELLAADTAVLPELVVCDLKQEGGLIGSEAKSSSVECGEEGKEGEKNWQKEKSSD